MDKITDFVLNGRKLRLHLSDACWSLEDLGAADDVDDARGVVVYAKL